MTTTETGQAARNTRYVKAKRLRGECGWPGCREKSGDAFRCPEHAAAHASKMQLARQKARAA